jgi:hypothetical protein
MVLRTATEFHKFVMSLRIFHHCARTYILLLHPQPWIFFLVDCQRLTTDVLRIFTYPSPRFSIGNMAPLELADGDVESQSVNSWKAEASIFYGGRLGGFTKIWRCLIFAHIEYHAIHMEVS